MGHGDLDRRADGARDLPELPRSCSSRPTAKNSTDLGNGVNAAVKAGATEISNSYGGPRESRSTTSAEQQLLRPPRRGRRPPAPATAATSTSLHADLRTAANFPADSPDVVAVGGTSLSGITANGGARSGTTAAAAAASCSRRSSGRAPPKFSATGCGSGRSVADVSAVGDPDTGVDVYDSTPDGTATRPAGVSGEARRWPRRSSRPSSRSRAARAGVAYPAEDALLARRRSERDSTT